MEHPSNRLLSSREFYENPEKLSSLCFRERSSFSPKPGVTQQEAVLLCGTVRFGMVNNNKMDMER